MWTDQGAKICITTLHLPQFKKSMRQNLLTMARRHKFGWLGLDHSLGFPRLMLIWMIEGRFLWFRNKMSISK